jgi:hypothetical protein
VNLLHMFSSQQRKTQGGLWVCELDLVPTAITIVTFVSKTLNLNGRLVLTLLTYIVSRVIQ